MDGVDICPLIDSKRESHSIAVLIDWMCESTSFSEQTMQETCKTKSWMTTTRILSRAAVS